MAAEAKRNDQDHQEEQIGAWSLTAPRNSLKKDPALATLVLRLGAAINAIRAVQRWTLACQGASGPAGQRDRVWSFLVSGAYLKEAIDGLLRPHYGDIVRLARENGTPEQAIKALGRLTSKKGRDLYARILVNARNKLVFHWEEEAFRDWAETYDNAAVVWVQGTGNEDGEVVFEAANAAILDSLIPGAGQAEIRSRVGEIAEASGLLVGVFQRAIHAYLSEYG